MVVSEVSGSRIISLETKKNLARRESSADFPVVKERSPSERSHAFRFPPSSMMTRSDCSMYGGRESVPEVFRLSPSRHVPWPREVGLSTCLGMFLPFFQISSAILEFLFLRAVSCLGTSREQGRVSSDVLGARAKSFPECEVTWVTGVRSPLVKCPGVLSWCVTQGEYDKVAIGLQSRLNEKEYKCREIAESFTKFKREVGHLLVAMPECATW